jgi:hypothetical protein
MVELKAGTRADFRRLPDGTRTARARAETRQRILARKTVGRGVIPANDSDEGGE